MAHDILLGRTSRDWSTGSLPKGATGYVPKKWWTETEAEADVQKNMKDGGLFGSKLPREDAEKSTLAFMKAKKIGIMSGIGSLLIPSKQQKAFMAKIDDVRYDVRRAGAKIGGATLILSAALGLLGVASLYKTFKTESRESPQRNKSTSNRVVWSRK
jgi:hypothetical protein